MTTSAPEAQLWFDRGLVWCYAYFHDEAVACFKRALDADPVSGGTVVTDYDASDPQVIPVYVPSGAVI